MDNRENQEASAITAYEREKALGLRDESGRHILKELKPIHKQVVSDHLDGLSNREIAKKHEVHEQTISRWLNDPKVRAYIEISYIGLEQELRGLIGPAIEVIRSAYGSRDTELGLKAISQHEKLYKMITPEGRELSKGGSLSISIGQGVEQEDNTSAVDRLAEKLSQMFERKPVLFKDVVDVEAEVIEVHEVKDE